MGLQKRGTRTIVGILCALWLWMFIYPMYDLGLLINPDSFIPVFMIMAMLSPFRSKWLHMITLVFVSFFSVAVYFQISGTSLLNKLGVLLHTDISDLVSVLHGNTLEDPLQTQLFIGLMFIVYWLIMFASSRRRLWLFYNVLGIIVLCIVDVNTSVHPNTALVVNVMICLCVLAIARVASISEVRHEAVIERIVTPVLTVISGICAIGLILPKESALWASPVNWAIGPSNQTQSEQQVIGFQEDDSKLGGSIEMNYAPVLTVTEPFPSYMRGQALETYTGKGWGPMGLESIGSFQLTVPIGPDEDYSNLNETTATQDVTLVSDSLRTNVLFGAYSIHDVLQFQKGGIRTLLFHNQSTGTITGLNSYNGGSYRVTSHVMTSPVAQLQAQKPFTYETEQSYPAGIGPFLELPAELPGRVRDLARTVASGGGTEYDIVMRIENFLQQNYRYDTQNIPVPSGNTDYVDQFLFQTKRGYCNNFSTAMAVMLRAVNIPTRWVTGFAPGEQDLSYQGSGERYIIRNSDAHSWVEVYFPYYGWVPFDPTPTFTMVFAPSSTNAQTGPGSSSTRPGKQSGGGQTGTPKKQAHLPGDTGGTSPVTSSTASQGHVGTLILLILFAMMVVGACVSYLFRKDILVFRYRKLWKSTGEYSGFRRAIDLIFRLTNNSDTKSSTLRELQGMAETAGIDNREYREFVQTTEALWYGTESVAPEKMEKLRDIWLKWVRNLVKRSKR